MLGETISLIVAVSWTVTALFAEVASKRLGAMQFNVIRMTMALVMFALLLFCLTGTPFPQHCDGETWLWLILSGVVGYVLGDYCLFNSYVLIGSRFGQLLMTLAPPSAAVFGFVLLGERMSWHALAGMAITISGIAVSLYRRREAKDGARLPGKGILFGIGAGVCQGIGLVLSAKGLRQYGMVMGEQYGSDTWVFVFVALAATYIRTIAGFAGFTLWAAARNELRSCFKASRDVRGMCCAFGATFTGPFFGVTLSLLATQYTSTGIAQTIMSLTPILILLPSMIIFKQRIGIRDVIGAVISVWGVTFFF